MIAAKDAIRTAAALMGTPYAQLDCIGFIRKVISTAQGGVKNYTTAGTNTLWRSIEMSEKYCDLIWRKAGIAGAKAGMLAFKADGEDVHHVGLVAGGGMVIHSTSTQGGRGVVKTPLTAREGWTHLARHRYIAVEEEADMVKDSDGAKAERAVVVTQGGKLNVRDMPDGSVIAQIENGSEVEITGGEGEWLRIHFGESRSGYVFAAYLSRKAAQKKKRMRIIDEAGDIYEIEGAFTVQVIGDD